MLLFLDAAYRTSSGKLEAKIKFFKTGDLVVVKKDNQDLQVINGLSCRYTWAVRTMGQWGLCER